MALIFVPPDAFVLQIVHKYKQAHLKVVFFLQFLKDNSHFKHILVLTYFGNIKGLVLEHCKKVNITLNQVK